MTSSTAAATPLPRPSAPDLARARTAADLLAGLRARDPRLLLFAADISRLTPAVSTWLERGIEPTAVQQTLTTLLPQEPLHHPAGFLAHRLTTLLPPPLPPEPEPAPHARPHPFQTCETCDRAFRAPEPGRCKECAADES
ncbi:MULTISPECIES: hypothetical protein [unclassified Streptomyces]|uniref:hypothetical protein n=1 Tax=unclassified Streptomyces TaxID=2593676 RepID=UPI002B1CC899|nr:hypothetical protein [Streptomyces sp. NBC_01500]WSV55903.1 hypothetical protein OG282_20565 [Streptomyces sp. NBC_01014]